MSEPTNRQQHNTTGAVCRDGVNCRYYPNCRYGHPDGTIPPCPKPYCSDRNCRFYHSSMSASQTVHARHPSSSGSGPKKQFPSKKPYSSKTSQTSQQSRQPQTFKDDRRHKPWKKRFPKPLTPSREAPSPPTPPRGAPPPPPPPREVPPPPTPPRDRLPVPKDEHSDLSSEMFVPSDGIDTIITDVNDEPILIITPNCITDINGNPVRVITEKVENNVEIAFVITTDGKCIDLSGNVLGIIEEGGHFVSFQTIEVDSSRYVDDDDELNLQLTQDINTTLRDNTWVQSLLEKNEDEDEDEDDL